MIVHFVNIGRIVDHHCLNFLFINQSNLAVLNLDSHNEIFFNDEYHTHYISSCFIIMITCFVVRAAFYYEVYLLLLRCCEGSFLLRGILIVITFVVRAAFYYEVYLLLLRLFLLCFLILRQQC
jgi:hypothetical protein